MRKKGILVVIALLLSFCMLISCGKQAPAIQTLKLDSFQNSDGQFAFVNLSFQSTIEDVERIYSCDVGKPVQTKDQVQTYQVSDVFEFEDNPLVWNLEFENKKLRTLQFSFMTEDIVELEKFYTEIADSFLDLYGVATKTMDNSGTESGSSTTMLSKGMRWDASVNGQNTSLQLVMMTGNKIKPIVSIGVGVIS